MPDTFASRAAAVADDNADAAIGNVTGSNAVNIYLGIGLAWLLGAIVQNVRGCPFAVEPGDITFSVIIFTAFCLVGFGVILFRRLHKSIRTELGGPRKAKIISALILVLLWLLYIILVTLGAYGVIKTF